MQIRVCDQQHIRLNFLTKPRTGTKKFLAKTPFKTHVRFLTMSCKVGSLPGFKTLTNNLKFFKLTRQEVFLLQSEDSTITSFEGKVQNKIKSLVMVAIKN